MESPTLLCLSAGYELGNFEEAVQEKRWRNPRDKEVQAIKKDNIRYHISIPKDRKATNGKWMNKTKKNVKGKFEGHKARLVANGYNKKGNYENVFIPSRSPGYRKARNLSSFSTQTKNLSDIREMFLFEWSHRKRIGVHQATSATQGKKKRRLGDYQVK